MFKDIFPVKKPIIGMIHLAGESGPEKVVKALEELSIYDEEGIDGAIIENYHGRPEDVYEALNQAQDSTPKLSLALGMNILGEPEFTFEIAKKFGARFIQFDSVLKKHPSQKWYDARRREYPDIVVLGGVRFKYQPSTGKSLEEDIKQGISRCDAAVTTGDGTGIETLTGKLLEFKEKLGDFPLIVGAGVNLDNAYEQLQISDGAIIGSYFKEHDNTERYVDRKKVRDIMDIARSLR